LIQDAKISAKPTGNEASFTTTTNRQGQFIYPNLVPGQYVVTVEQVGFSKLYKTVTLAPGQTTEISLTLSLNDVTQNVEVTAQLTTVAEAPSAQTITSVDRQDFKDAPSLNISESLALIPGVTTVGGNGPRDVSVSVRGSNDRQTYGIRNAQIFEDGFPVTQPDGLARTDLTDPHAYGGIDVVQGPSSTLYGNYATGGAIDFHLRPGGNIMGLEFGTDVGSFGFLNNYITAGTQRDRFHYSLFMSNTRSRQFTDHSAYDTITANILATYAVTPKDRVTFKFIENDLDTALSIRLSLNQYNANAYQADCSSLAGTACAAVSVYSNGFTGPKVSLSADQAGLGRHDRRTITGSRWEHDFTDNLTWRTQFVWDNRDINQPTSSTSSRGTYPSFNLISDGTRHGPLFGRQSTTYAGGFFNYENISSYSYNLMPGGNATLGALTATTFGSHMNTGFRAHEEFAVNSKLTAVAGFAGEYTRLVALDTIYGYSATAAPSTTPISALRTFFNIAPEAALLYRVSDRLRLHSRLGTGYGTPQATNLFITPQGTYGNNTQLKTQKNVGIDFGGDWTLSDKLKADATAFYERFGNELVSQSAGVNAVGSYTFNAPSSAHRGMEAGIDWHPLPELARGLRFRASYLLDRQIYRNYTENLSISAATVPAGYVAFVRNGNCIPGVVHNDLNGRVVYEATSSRFGSMGSYLEVNFRDKYWLDNANLLQAPSATVFNLDLHYDPAPGHGLWSRTHFFYDLQNLANRTYVGSASNATDTLSTVNGAAVENNAAYIAANSTGLIYAGMPRASYGGFRIKF